MGDMLTDKEEGTCLELTKSVAARTRESTGTLNNGSTFQPADKKTFSVLALSQESDFPLDVREKY